MADMGAFAKRNGSPRKQPRARLGSLIADAVERAHDGGLQALLQVAPGHQLQLARLVRADVVLRARAACECLPPSKLMHVQHIACSHGWCTEDALLL